MRALVNLATNLQKRLIAALESGRLTPPYSPDALLSVVGSIESTEALQSALTELADLGITGPAAAAWIRTLAEARSGDKSPDLVWSGPKVSGIATRNTREVFEEMLGTATTSIWASTYAYYDGQKAFATLARRMDEQPNLSVTLFLNIERPFRNESPINDLINQFAHRFWNEDWPGQRKPEVFYFDQSLHHTAERSALHAKAIVKDQQWVLITSANFTEAALDRNIELGLWLKDPALAQKIIHLYQSLIEDDRLRPLPS